MGRKDDIDSLKFYSTPSGPNPYHQEWEKAVAGDWAQERWRQGFMIRASVWTRKRLFAKANALLRKARR